MSLVPDAALRLLEQRRAAYRKTHGNYSDGTERTSRSFTRPPIASTTTLAGASNVNPPSESDRRWDAAMERVAKMTISDTTPHGATAVIESQDTRQGEPPLSAADLIRRGRLDCEIPSDLESMDRLSMHFPWLPNSACIRPTDTIQSKKKNYMQLVGREYRSIGDRVLEDIFHYQTSIVDGRQVALSPDVIQHQRALRPHKFPYNVREGTNHAVLWFYPTVASQLRADTITRYVREELAISPDVPAGTEVEFVWYENPKMTVPQIYHVQVFWRIKHNAAQRYPISLQDLTSISQVLEASTLSSMPAEEQHYENTRQMNLPVDSLGSVNHTSSRLPRESRDYRFG